MTNRVIRNIAPAKQPKAVSDGLSVIIPAAGAGNRMKYCGPKALITTDDGQTILERQIKIIRYIYPNADIIVSVGFEHEKILRRYWHALGVRFVYNYAHNTLGVLHSLSLALHATVNQNLLIVYGDLVFNLQTIAGIAGKHSQVLIAPTDFSGVGLITDGEIVTNFAFDLPTKWGQIAYLTGKEFALFAKAAFNDDNAKWCGHEALNYVISNGGTLYAFKPSDMKLKEIDSPKDLE